jgi:hypothetical protein
VREFLGDAVPRDPSEAIEVPLNVPGLTGDAPPASFTVRRGFVGTFASWQFGSGGFDGRRRVSAVIERWDGDTPTVVYRTEVI